MPRTGKEKCNRRASYINEKTVLESHSEGAHCAAKYAEEVSSASNDDILDELNHQATEATRNPEATTQQWTWEVTIQARASLSRQKSTGRGGVSAEVLQAISSEALWALHDMMSYHYMHASARPMS